LPLFPRQFPSVPSGGGTRFVPAQGRK
jgi:hypothetical protein